MKEFPLFHLSVAREEPSRNDRCDCRTRTILYTSCGLRITLEVMSMPYVFERYGIAGANATRKQPLIR